MKGELWMDKVREGGREGVSGQGLCPADRQAASWSSHLATQSQREMMGHLCICNVL